ncbi:MAG: hypothetical protein ACE5E7_13750 [Anaerolineae bacterium]
MIDKQLTPTGSDWREQVAYLHALLNEVRDELVEAEAELAERLAAINAFEFKLRARLRPFINRLDAVEADIEQYRRRLFQLGESWQDEDGNGASWFTHDAEAVFDSAAAAAADYRYMGQPPPSPPPSLSADESAEIKRLFRRLARRFHPDMGVDEADRERRTRLMMAINAAYAAHDLAGLQQLALEPDSLDLAAHAKSDQQLAEVLFRELGRCRRRHQEVKEELAVLARHKSTSLMHRVEQAAANGRDLLAEIVAQLQEKIARRMVERDVLKSELEQLDASSTAVHGERFADAVWDFSLDQAFAEDPDSDAEAWVNKRRGRFGHDEDLLDEAE